MSIDLPLIEIRNGARLAAEAIGRTAGPLSPPDIEAQIAARRELLLLIEGGLDAPFCEELTNANPSSPHTVLLEAFAWVIEQQSFRFNRIPEANLIAFANLFGIDLLPAASATTTLRFTVDPPEDTDVVIAEGTQVATADGQHVFETTEEITIEYGDETGDAPARRTVTGRTLLSPNVLTKLIDNPAYVESVSNPTGIDSGREIETVANALERARRYQRRGERIVSVKDLEDAIAEEGLLGNGVVRVFPFVRNGEFGEEKKVGHTTAVVMTKAGDAIDNATRQRIAALTDTAVGNQFIYVVDPSFVDFSVTADLLLNTGSPEGAVLADIETNLRAFYAASRENFGRPVLRSEIIAVIEGTTGVDRIVAGESSILASPTADSKLLEYQVPRLVDVNLNVV